MTTEWKSIQTVSSRNSLSKSTYSKPSPPIMEHEPIHEKFRTLHQ